jgi:hypothetical protein
MVVDGLMMKQQQWMGDEAVMVLQIFANLTATWACDRHVSLRLFWNNHTIAQKRRASAKTIF